MKFLDLFSGIGGFALGLERAGMEVAAFCEIDPFCRAVLKKHWPDVPIYGDIRELNVDELPAVDLVCGGFPCQPFSCAGKRKGESDDRYLWPEMFRIIKALRPRWVLGENVAGIVNLALDIVLSDLESEDYETGAFIIPACAVDAPHRRDRVWIVAYAAGEQIHSKYESSIGSCERGWNALGSRQETSRQKDRETSHNRIGGRGQDVAHAEGTKCQRAGVARGGRAGLTDGGKDVAYTNGPGLQRHGKLRECTQQPLAGEGSNAVKGTRLTQPGVGGVLDGLTDWLDSYRWPAPFGCEQYKWEPPRITVEKVPYRRQRLQALGNAVVPQIVEAIGRAILEAERLAVRND